MSNIYSVSELAAENYEGGRKSLLTQSRLETKSLKLLRAAIETEQILGEDETIISSFIDDNQGMRQLSFSINAFHKLLEDSSSSSPSEPGPNRSSSSSSLSSTPGVTASERTSLVHAKTYIILEGLALGLECMCAILNTFSINRVRGLISKWSEADDMNFLCCQLVTRSSLEWDRLLEQEEKGCIEKGRVESMRVIEYASGILTVLASVETIAEAESE